MRIRLLLFFAALVFQAHAQNPSAQFAKWKNNTKAVYTLTHDDYASFWIDGIQEYADTIAYNRGVRFTFGVITGSCDSDDWKVARRLISHGHEVMNHTHTHACNHVTTVCPSGGWNYANELDLSTNLIFTNTNSYPRYFIWPYDVFDQTSKDYLKNTLHYYGGRGGNNGETLDASQLNGKDIPDFFNTNFSIHSTTTDLAELNGLVDLAIAEGKWGVREVHGVNDASYASIPLANYRNHCDYIKSKIEAGVLWNANASEVTTYLMQARAFVPTVTLQPQYSRIKIGWNNPVLDVSDLRSPVTVNVDLDGLTDYLYAYQNGEPLTLVNYGDSVAVNCFPHKGEVYLYNYDLATVDNSFSFEQYRTFVRQGEQGIAYSISTHDADEYFWSYSDAATTVHANGDHATLDFSSGSGNGKVRVAIVKNGKVSLPKTLDVTVLAVNDASYSCPAPSQVTFSITNQNNKKFLWLDAPEGGNPLAFASTLNRTNPAAADTFYIARQDDSVLVNVVPSYMSYNSVPSGTARKISVQQPLIFRSISFGISQSGPQTVDIYAADGQTKIFSTTKSFAENSVYTFVSVPLNTSLAAGDYYIKVSAGFSDYFQTVPLTVDGYMTLYQGGYGVAGDGSINLSDTKTANQTVQIALYAVKPGVLYPERVAVYLKPVGPSGTPASYTGPQSVCAGTTRNYTVPTLSGLTSVYHYSDGIYDTTVTSNSGASIVFKDRFANGILSVQYKNTCGGLSSALTIPITVLKPELSNLVGPSFIYFPDTINYTYTKSAGAAVSWSLTGGGLSTISQTATQSTLRTAANLQDTYSTSLSYTVSEAGCSQTYPITVSLYTRPPVITLLSPTEAQQFAKGESVPLLASVSNTFGRPMTCYFKIICSGYPSVVVQYQVGNAPYQATFLPDYLTGNCSMTLTNSLTGGLNSIQRTFYISNVTDASSQKESRLVAYPNPTAGQLYVPADWLNGLPVSCTAVDAMGKVVELAFSNHGGELQFDFSPLASGLYRLNLSSGDKQYSVNVIKFDGQ